MMLLSTYLQFALQTEIPIDVHIALLPEGVKRLEAFENRNVPVLQTLHNLVSLHEFQLGFGQLSIDS